ncbi:MAG: hypothetical protein V4721_11070 [Bacteroidota bacterium]
MAKQKRNVVMSGFTGKVNEQLLFKQYLYGTVVSKVPDRSKVVLSDKQKISNAVFAKAVQYAKRVLQDPAKYSEYQARLVDGKTVYNTAIADYFAQNKS